MEAAGYALDLYCDDPDHVKRVGVKSDFIDAQYHGQTYKEVKAKAIKNGWKWKKGKNICPKCAISS